VLISKITIVNTLCFLINFLLKANQIILIEMGYFLKKGLEKNYLALNAQIANIPVATIQLLPQ